MKTFLCRWLSSTLRIVKVVLWGGWGLVFLAGEYSAIGASLTWTGTSSSSWSTGGVGGNWNSAGPPVSGDDIVFNNLSTANLSTNNDIASLSLSKITIVNPAGAVGIAGNPFTLTGGIDMSAATQDLTISPTVTLSGTQSLNIASGRTLTLNNTPTLAADSVVSKNGTGTLAVTPLYIGNGVSNTFNVTAGTVSAANFRVGQGTDVTGTLNQTGGTINAATYLIIGGISGSSSCKGVYNMQDGSLNVLGTLYCAWNGNAQINQSGGTITTARLDSATDKGNGEYNLSGGTLKVTDTAHLGFRFTTTFKQTGGEAEFKNLELGSGYPGGAGTADYTISGSTAKLTITSGGRFYVGGSTGGTGRFYVNGGTTTVNADMYVGAVASANGTVTQTAGTVTIDPAKALRFGSTGSYSAVYNLNGGVLTLANIVFTDTNAQKFNFGGGTLQANGNLTTSMPMTINAGGATIDTQANTVTLSGVLSGAGALTKVGTGTLTLTGANTYTSGTTVSAGTLQGDTTSLQGAITNNATLVFNQTAAGTFNGTLSGSGTLTKTGTGALTLQSGSVGTININAGELIKGTTGTLSVTSGNLNVLPGTRYTHTDGTTTISGAYGLNVSGSSAGDAVVTQTGGTINATGLYCIIGSNQGDTGGKAVYNMQGGSLNVSSRLYCAWRGNAQINQSGGTITTTNLDSATDNGDGEYNLSGGTLKVTGTAQLGFRFITTFNQTGGEAEFKNLELGSGYAAGAGTADYTISGSTAKLTITSGGRFYVGGSTGGTGRFYVNGGTTTVNADMYVGAVASANGTVTQTAGTVTIDPTKALRFGSTGSYSAVYNLNGGVLTLANIVFTDTNAQKFNFGGGTLQANGNLTTSMPMTINAGGATIDTQANTVTLSGVLSGAGALTKVGTGTLTLTGANTYSGGTTVSAGTLALVSSTSNNNIPGSSVIQVGAEATLDVTGLAGTVDLILASGQTLQGNGTVSGNVQTPAGAFLGAGMSPGHLTIQGSYTQAGKMLVELAGYTQGGTKAEPGQWTANGYDWVSVGGSAVLDGYVDIALLAGFQPQPGDAFYVLTATGGITDQGITLTWTQPLLPAQYWTYAIVPWEGQGGGETLMLSFGVPEPATWLLLLLGGLGLVLSRSGLIKRLC